MIENDKVEALKVAIQETFGVELEDLQRRDHHGNITDIRHISISVLRNNSRMSTMEIGKVFKRNHPLVLYALDKVNTLRKVDEYYSTYYKKLEQKFTELLCKN